MQTQPEFIPCEGPMGPVTTLTDGRIVSAYVERKGREEVDTEHPQRWSYLRYSEDHGRTWGDPVAAFAHPAGKGLISAGLPFADREGALHLFCLRFYALGWQNERWHSVLLHNVSSDGGRSWSGLQQIDFGHPYTGALNGALQLESGRILLALSYLSQSRQDGRFVSMVVYSDDAGSSWHCSNDCAVGGGGTFVESGAIEPVLTQFASGMAWMVIRTTTGYFWESFSHDGAVWTPPRQSRIVSSNAPAGVLRLQDGRIALFWNNLYGEPFRDGISYARQQLHGAISADEGQTWSPPRVVASRGPEEPLKAQTTYPFLCQAHDGAIVLFYHRVYARPERDWFDPITELVRVDPEWLAGGL